MLMYSLAVSIFFCSRGVCEVVIRAGGYCEELDMMDCQCGVTVNGDKS